MTIKIAVENYLENHAKALEAYWLKGDFSRGNSISLQDHCDYIYLKTLMGAKGWFCLEAVNEYAVLVANLPLAGRKDCDNRLLPHITAYLLASLNLLASQGADVRSAVLASIELELDLLIDNANLPKWPLRWSHHTWRVSHWIGGIPSILLSFSRHDPRKLISEEQVYSVLNACDLHVIDNESGLLRAYRSDFIQKLFRAAYRIRHNPEHGDIGGLVHIHWINHILGRKYKCQNYLLDLAVKHIGMSGFLESKPYCLDFDYLQLIRTIVEQRPELHNSALRDRVMLFRNELVCFLSNIPLDGYSLHKIPGALASLHEASILLGEDVDSLDMKPIDIIKTAYWI